MRAEPSITFAGVSKMDTGAVVVAAEYGIGGFDGVAKIVLRAAPEENVLEFGALDGVSAILDGARPWRPDALRCPVAATIEGGP